MYFRRIGRKFILMGLSVIVILLACSTGIEIKKAYAAAGDPFYIGNAIHYADTNDSLYRSTPLTTQIDNITMETWVKADTISSADTNIRIMYNGISGSSGYGIYLAGVDKYPCILMGGIAFIGMVTPETINTGVWYHLAAVRDNGVWKLYINGVEKALSSNTLAPNAIAPTDSFSIGNNNLVPESFNGCFDEVRFWTVARTAQQIRDNMYVKLDGNEAGLLAYYNFDQSEVVPGGDNTSITAVSDLAGGDQNLTVSGFALDGTTSNFIQSVQLGQFQFENASYSVGEQEGNVRVAITRTGGSEGSVAINYSTLDGTAVAGTNYTITNGSVTFASGETRKEIDIPVINSGITETKDFTMSLSAQSGVQFGANSSTAISVQPNAAGGESAVIGTGFSYPYGVAMDSSDNIYVAISGSNTVEKMDSTGVAISTWTGFNSPYGVAVDNSGNIYAANYAGDTLTKMDSYGSVVATFTFPFMSSPTGVALDSSGNYLYVAFEGSGDIKKMDSSSGTVDGTFTSPSFNAPAGVAVDSIGNIYVADTMGNTITKMSSSGAVDGTFISPLLSNQYPVGVAVDGSDNLYVSYQDYDATLGYVIKMNSNTGEIVDTYDGFINPQCLAADSGGNLYVADAYDGTVTKLTFSVADTTPPTISSVDLSPISTTNGDVTVTVTATDASGIAATGGYSFDGGTSWQDGNSKVYTANTTIAAGQIKVKDTAGNIAAYGTQIDITNIDTDFPILTAGAVNRTNMTDGTVKFTSNKVGEYYYEIVADGDSEPVLNTTGAGTACPAGETTIYLTGLSDFAKDIYIKVKDAAGNVSDALKIDLDGYSYTTANALNNTVTVNSSSIFVGGSVVITAVGDRQETVTGSVYGDEKFVPAAWTSDEAGKSGTFSLNTDSYTAVYTPSALGNYTIAAEFVKQQWNGSGWVDVGNSNKTVGLTVSEPGDFSLTATPGDSMASLEWMSVTDAVYYDIYINNTFLHSVTDDVYQYDVTNLSNGITYIFKVKALDSDETVISISDEVSAKPVGAPGAPANVTAVAGNRQATVSFTAPANNGGSPITSYVVTSNPDGITATGIGTNITVTGLSNGTAYTFTVRAVNAVGEGQESSPSNAVTPRAPTSGRNSNPPASPQPTNTDNAGVEILINGKSETAATSTTTVEENRIVTTVVVNDKKVEERLQNEGNNVIVTIPVNNKSDVVIGQLNGQTVKNMETKEAVLEIKTEGVTYTLPASQINIDNVSERIGKQVELKDIKVNVTISAAPQDTVKVIEDTANKNNYQVVVKPIEFNITCSSGGKTVEVSKFNGYVERMVAIPDGIDPSKITTGIVINADGTFSHVPTVITIINGKYYAKINSLTNSAYSVIWSPKTFKDVEKHWAKDAVNDMVSRLVISGVGNGMFEPDRDIARGEFAAIVVRALGLMRPGTGKDSFNDVTKNDWYYDAVSIAYENGIISGYDNDNFGPMDKITREQAMIMIARAMKITGLKPEIKDSEVSLLLANYADGAVASTYAKTSIAACLKTGVITGRNGSTIAPRNYISRAEVAVIIQRLLQKSNLI